MKVGRIVKSNAQMFNTGSWTGGAWRQSTVSERRRLCVDVTAGLKCRTRDRSMGNPGFRTGWGMR